MSNETIITAQPGEPFVDVVRVVDAPVETVWRAYTEADLFAKWIGPRQYDTEVTAFDVRDGGAWAFAQGDSGGRFAFRGVFHSVTPREQITQTFEFLGAPGHVNLDRVSFEDFGGSTRITTRTAFQSVESRDAMVAAGMARGVTEGYERMDELLASLG